jgi:hypothetical protein
MYSLRLEIVERGGLAADDALEAGADVGAGAGVGMALGAFLEQLLALRCVGRLGG